MTSITEFILARVAEDEQAAKAATTGPWERTVDEHNGSDGVDVGIWSDAAERYPVESMVIGNHNALADARHIVRHDPERVLAECEAKRRIVKLHDYPCQTCGAGRRCVVHDVSAGAPSIFYDRQDQQTLSALAAIWSDHDDYRGEWRP